MDRDLSTFEERIGYRFQSRDLLTRALTHKSYSHEARNENAHDNETFEFLGDSVLGFVIGDVLFKRFPALDEGALSKMKAYLVSATSLAEKARSFGQSCFGRINPDFEVRAYLTVGCVSGNLRSLCIRLLFNSVQ